MENLIKIKEKHISQIIFVVCFKCGIIKSVEIIEGHLKDKP